MELNILDKFFSLRIYLLRICLSQPEDKCITEINEQNSIISIILLNLKCITYFDIGITVMRDFEVTFAIFCIKEHQMKLIFFRSKVGMLQFLDPHVNT